MKESGEQFLNEKYPDLQHSPEVESAVNRQEIRSGEKATDKNERLEAYLSRLEEIFDVENPKRERRVEFLKTKLHEQFVIKPEDIPESYFKNQQRIARERGHGDVEITDEMKRQSAETIINDQQQSLDAWVDYLGSTDATYPNWLKYFAFRSITKLSEYDKEKKEFKKRSKGTTGLFPDINREALAYVLDELEQSHKKQVKEGATDQEWEKLLKTANFGKLYAYAIEKVTPASEEEKENIQGEWIKYEQGGDAESLYKSLQGHGTGWCTAGEGVAKAQLEAGDFHVFYTKGKDGRNAVPRVAIRMENGQIAEVRGIERDQNLEASMTDVAKDKVKELPGGDRYEKKVADMKRLTEIEEKLTNARELDQTVYARRLDEGISEDIWEEELQLEEIRRKNAEVALSKEELRFLYEIDGEIEGFGYQEDPRIWEIKSQRDKRKDYSAIYDLQCQPEEVAFLEEEINGKTKVFIGDFIFRNTRSGWESHHPIRMTEMPENLERIIGNADFTGSDVRDLEKLRFIDGWVAFYGSKIENFGNLERISGSAIFSQYGFVPFLQHSQKSLPNLKFIGGDAIFRHSAIETTGLEEVGGDVIVEEGSKLDLSGVKIGGKIEEVK